jgi:hypothetical protein
MAACPVCVHPMISTITSMVDCGADVLQIAESCGLSTEEVEQHLAECCKSPAAPTSLQASDERLALLADRISAAIVSSGLSGDTRGQLQALSLGVRAELEFRRRLEQQVQERPIPRVGMTEHEQDLVRNYLDTIIPRFAPLIESTPVEVVESYLASMPETPAVRARLVDELQTYASVWVNLENQIPAIPESLRLLDFRLGELKRRQARALEERCQNSTN